MHPYRIFKYVLPIVVVSACLIALAATRSDEVQAESATEWSVPVPVHDDCCSSDLAVGSDSTVHIIVDGYAGEAYYIGKPVGGGWSTPIMISPDLWNYGLTYSDLEFDASGDLHFVFEYSTSTDHQVWYNQRPAALGGWVTPSRLSGVTDSIAPVLAIDSNGGLHVVAAEKRYGSDHLLYFYKPSDGTWIGPAQISEAIIVQQYFQDAAVGPDDTLHVVFTRDGLSYINRPAAGVWSAPIVIGPSEASRISPRIYADGAGVLYVFWGSDDLGSLQYSTKSPGSAWTTPISIPNTTPADWVDLDVDAWENAHLVWKDSQASEVYYISRNHVDGSWSDPIALIQTPVPHEGVRLPRVAVGPDGALYAIWYDDGQYWFTSAPPPYSDTHVYLPLVVRNR